MKKGSSSQQSPKRVGRAFRQESAEEISGSSSARLALSFSRVPWVISPRLSRASKDGCSTQKDVHLATGP